MPRSAVRWAVALCWLLAAGACRESPAPKSPETLAVEEKAGDFLDYHEDVLRLSREYAAAPDSFRAALDSLPGSHLTDEEWEAWTAPYRERPGIVADRLEEILSDLAGSR